MSNDKLCASCHRKPRFQESEFCFSCLQEQKGSNQPTKVSRQDRKGGEEVNFIITGSFYTDATCKYFRSELFIEAPEAFVDYLLDKRLRLTSSALRQLYRTVKNAERRLKNEPNLTVDFARNRYDIFERQCRYQVGRKIIAEEFLRLVEDHSSLAKQSKEEFYGFVEYLTSILAWWIYKGERRR